MNDGFISILLVDDHQLVRQGLRRLVEAEKNLRVVGEASDEGSAMELVRQLKPDFVVMDVHLAQGSGIEAGRRISTEFPKTKIIALSSDPSPQTAVKALRSGFSGYVIKENRVEELIRAIREVSANKIYLCPSVSTSVTQCFMESIGDDEETIGKPELTERERRLLVLVAEGKRGKEIADVLQVNPKSIETYRSRLMKKLGCTSIADLTRYAIREGIIKV
jgi:two-component system, NarL family, response regulator NreC